MRYGHTKQKDVESFFSKGRTSTASASLTSAAAKEAEAVRSEIPENVAAANALGDAFEIVDPIETCVGPIGRFQLKPENFPLHPSVCLFGKRRTGKTFTLRDILAKCFQHIPFGIVCSQTAGNGFWQQYVPPRFVFQDLQMHKLQALLDRQDAVIAKWKKDHPKECAEDADAYKKVPELAAYCILDDVISDRIQIQWMTQLNYLFVNGRHKCMSVFITSQHVKGVGPMIRGNMDVVVLQPIFQREARDTLADLYGGWMDKKLFFALMDDIVEDENLPGSTPQQPKKRVRTMIINDFENTTNPQIKFKWNEAEDPGDFKLSLPQYWKDDEFNSKGSYKTAAYDAVEELEDANNLQNFRIY